MIAACDTFRSGAVEQLKTHCNRLSIPLYERGYEKDPAKVAYEATMQAARSKTDVVLVDTAGAPILRKQKGGMEWNKFWSRTLDLSACRGTRGQVLGARRPLCYLGK